VAEALAAASWASVAEFAASCAELAAWSVLLQAARAAAKPTAIRVLAVFMRSPVQAPWCDVGGTMHGPAWGRREGRAPPARPIQEPIRQTSPGARKRERRTGVRLSDRHAEVPGQSMSRKLRS